MLVVDAANVVGSRPNGWWRDRGRAAEHLCSGLVDAIHAGRLEPRSSSCSKAQHGRASGSVSRTASMSCMLLEAVTTRSPERSPRRSPMGRPLPSSRQTVSFGAGHGGSAVMWSNPGGCTTALARGFHDGRVGAGV